MSIENCHVLESIEKSNSCDPKAPPDSDQISESKDKSEEVQAHQKFITAREDKSSTVYGFKTESTINDNEATVTTKFLSCNTKIVIVPKISHSSQNKEKIQVQPDIQLNEADLIRDKSELKKRSSSKKCKLYTFDCLFAAIIVGPMVVGHWRGIWVLMDGHENIFTGWRCFIVGMSLHILFAIFRQPLHKRFAAGLSEKHCCARIGLRILRTIHIYLFSVACNSHWRGIWNILNDWFGQQAGVIACFTCAVLGDLLVLRCARNLLAPPFLITLDSAEFVFRFPTRYRLNTRDWSLYILDCAFSVGVVGTLVVFVWRGAWVLLDLYLFPESREHSAIGSLVIGYVLVAVAFSIQPMIRYACTRLQGLRRLIVADAFLLVSFLGTVNVWRGIWNALDLYLLPSMPQTSCWITHMGCFVFLVLLNCSNSILVRGVYIDGEEESGKCVVFPCHYLRLFFKEEREKKEARRRNLIVASRDLSGDPSSKEAENGALLNTSVTPIIQPACNPESLV